jgi:hypothetical protein
MQVNLGVHRIPGDTGLTTIIFLMRVSHIISAHLASITLLLQSRKRKSRPARKRIPREDNSCYCAYYLKTYMVHINHSRQLITAYYLRGMIDTS